MNLNKTKTLVFLFGLTIFTTINCFSSSIITRLQKHAGKANSIILVSGGLSAKMDNKGKIKISVPSCTPDESVSKKKVVDKYNKKGKAIKSHMEYVYKRINCVGYDNAESSNISFGISNTYQPYMEELISDVKKIYVPWVSDKSFKTNKKFAMLQTKKSYKGKVKMDEYPYFHVLDKFKTIRSSSFESFQEKNPKVLLMQLAYHIDGSMNVVKTVDNSKSKSGHSRYHTTIYTLTNKIKFILQARASLMLNGDDDIFESSHYRNMFKRNGNFITNENAGKIAGLDPDSIEAVVCEATRRGNSLVFTDAQEKNCLKEFNASFKLSKNTLLQKIKAGLYIIFP